jgi:Subtilisin inhibitor-like
MQSSLKPLAVGACVAAIAASFLVGPAAAAPDEPTLELSLQDQDNAQATLTSQTLGCDSYPDITTGSHPRRENACEVLEQAGGDFGRLPSTGMACTMIYRPVIATAKGQYRGVPIDFQFTYSNACVAASESGGVFTW